MCEMKFLDIYYTNNNLFGILMQSSFSAAISTYVAVYIYTVIKLQLQPSVNKSQ